MTTTKYVIEFKMIAPKSEKRKWQRNVKEHPSLKRALRYAKRYFTSSFYQTRIVQIYKRERIVQVNNPADS